MANEMFHKCPILEVGATGIEGGREDWMDGNKREKTHPNCYI
jgi:hypothetical protein